MYSPVSVFVFRYNLQIVSVSKYFCKTYETCIDLTHSNELKFVILMYSVLSLIRILNILDSLV